MTIGRIRDQTGRDNKAMKEAHRAVSRGWLVAAGLVVGWEYLAGIWACKSFDSMRVMIDGDDSSGGSVALFLVLPVVVAALVRNAMWRVQKSLVLALALAAALATVTAGLLGAAHAGCNLL